MKKRLTTLILGLAISFCLSAQTGTVTFKLQDHLFTPYPAASFRILETNDQVNQNESVQDLPVGAYTVSIFPSINGERPSSDLYRQETLTVVEGAQDAVFTWGTASLTLYLKDQNGVPLPASQFVNRGTTPGFSYFSVSSGTPITLPVTEDPDHDILGNRFADGYYITSLPGINNIEQGSDLYRREMPLELGPTGTEKTYVWKTAALTLHLNDQNGVPLPASQFVNRGTTPGFSYFSVSSGTPITLPVTEDPDHDILGNRFADGYYITSLPGINNIEQGSDLYRRETPLELEAGVVDKVYTWDTAPLTLHLVDQNGAPIPGNLFDNRDIIPGFSYFSVAGGTSITLPVTEDPDYDILGNRFADGYDIRSFPGFNGADGNGNLYRNEVPFELSVNSAPAFYYWKTYTAPLYLMDVTSGKEVCGASIRLPTLDDIYTGETVTIPVNDLAYPGIKGNKIDYDFRFRFDDSESFQGPFSMTLLSDGTFAPDPMIGTDYALRLELPAAQTCALGPIVDQCDFFDDYFTDAGWTQVGTGVLISNRKVTYSDAEDGLQRRIYQTLITTFNENDAWKAEFEFTPEEFGVWNGQPAAGHVLFALTAGTQEPFNNCTDLNCTDYPNGMQDGIIAIINSPNPPDGTVPFAIKVRDGGNEYTSDRVNFINLNITHYLTLERLGPLEIQLSVFTDADRTVHHSGSPVVLSIPPSSLVTGLNTIQHGNIAKGFNRRSLTGTVDNLCLTRAPFLNMDSGEWFYSMQRAMDAAGDGETILVDTDENVGAIVAPEGKTISITAIDGETVRIAEITFTEESNLKFFGDFKVLVEQGVSGTQNGESEWEIDNEGGVDLLGDINIDGFGTTIFTELNIFGSVLGGNPKDALKPYCGRGVLRIPLKADEFTFAPIGYVSEFTDEDGIYTPWGGYVDFLGADGQAEIRIYRPEDVEDQFPGARVVRYNTRRSESHLNYAIDLAFYDGNGDKLQSSVVDWLELAFPISQVVDPEPLLENPVLVHQGVDRANYYLATATGGKTLINGQKTDYAEGIFIKAGNVTIGSPLTVIGCPSCGEDKVLICQVADDEPENGVTTCIDKDDLIEELNNGSFCGPCEDAIMMETVAPRTLCSVASHPDGEDFSAGIIFGLINEPSYGDAQITYRLDDIEGADNLIPGSQSASVGDVSDGMLIAADSWINPTIAPVEVTYSITPIITYNVGDPGAFIREGDPETVSIVVMPKPSIDIDTEIVGVDYPTSGTCGNFDVLMDVTICNDGPVQVEDLAVTLELDDYSNDIFYGNARIIGIVGGRENFDDDLNTDGFDGDDDTDLFESSTSSLDKDKCTTVRVRWEVSPEKADSPEEAAAAEFRTRGYAMGDWIDLDTPPEFDADKKCFSDTESDSEELGNCWNTSRIAAANDNLNVSSDEGCDGIITPDMILENHYGSCDTGEEYPMGGFYRLRYLIPGSDELSDPELYLDLNRNDFPDGRVIIHVENVGNACEPLWGEISLEDKTPPTITCPDPIDEIDDIELLCDDINDADVLAAIPAPDYEDNCGSATLSGPVDVIEEFDPCAGDDIVYKLTRTWTVTDQAGNSASCDQIVTFERPSLSEDDDLESRDDVEYPTDQVDVSCDFVQGLLDADEEDDLTEADLLDENGHPTPLALELLGYDGYPSVTSVSGEHWLDESYCNIGASYEDISVIEVCENTIKIVRQWTLIDWCADADDQDALNNSIVVNHRQIIKFGDFEAPVLTDPGDAMTVGTGAFGCEGELTIPGLADDLIDENCSAVTVHATLHKTTIQPTYDKYGRPTGEGPVTEDLGSVTIGTTVDVEVGATYTIKYTATDACGNTSNEVDLDVTVEDNTAPVAVCDDDLHISIGGLGYAQVKDTDVDEGSWDNCGDVELYVSRKLSADVLDAYLAFVYDGLTFADLVPSGLPDLDNDSDAIIWVLLLDDADDDGEWDEGEASMEVLRQQGDMIFTWWRDQVAFICDDIAERVTIELLAQDDQGLTNKCWNDVLIEDKIRPVCDVDPEVTLPCTDLPYGFDPANADHVAALPVVGDATATDNCTVTTILDTVVVLNWNCNSGVIERSFTATDNGGLTSITPCVQTITVTPVNNYELIFPADPDPVICGDAMLDTVETNAIACDLLTINMVNDTFSASGTACYKIKRTYSVINWCEYDGESPAVEIGRDEDDNGITGDIDVYVLRDAEKNDDGDNVYIDDDADEKEEPLRTTVSTGYWTYIQYIKVIDNIAPEVTILGDDVFCSYDSGVDCDGEVTVPFTVRDECAGDDVLVKVFVDGEPVELEEDSYPNYSIKDTLALGEHEIEIHVLDGCGNSQLATRTIRVADCKAPSPICINGLSVELMRTEAGTDVDGDGEEDPAVMVIWASDFEVSTGEDCTGPATLSINRIGETPSRDSTSLTLTCKDPDTLAVEIYAWDNADSPIAIQPDSLEPGGPNYDHCVTYVVIQDNMFDLCEDPGQIGVAGLIENEDNETVENVSVSLSGMLSDNAITAVDGNYAFNSLTPGGDYTITPQKDDDYLNGVSTFDLVLITKHILGTKKLSTPYQLIAADINNSRSISALDLIQARKLILSVSDRFSHNTSWRFIPASYEFPDASNPWSQAFPEVLNYNDLQTVIASGDFVAVKIGDVNGNARANRLAGDQRSIAGVFNLSVEDQPVVAGNEYRVTFTAEEDVQGYQFTLNHEGLELMDIEYGAAKAEHFGLVEDGFLTTSWNQSSEAEPRTSADKFFTLVVRATVDGQLSDLLNVNSRYTTAEAYNPADELMDVALTFGGQTTTEGYELYQNVPNPFQGQTMISFRLPAAMAATVKIQDVTGRTLKVIRGEYARGFNQIRLNSSELASTGVLCYTLEADKFTASKKMIIVE